MRAVIFDMDGVIIDSEAPHFHSWQTIFKKFNLIFRKEDFRESFGKTTKAILKEYLERNKIYLDEEKIEELDEEKERIFRELIRKEITSFPGVIELIKRSKELKFKVAIASSGPVENIKVVIERLNLLNFIDCITSGAEVKESKPSPQIFLHTSKKLNLSPKDCLVIEDSPSGVSAAKKAGMKCVAVTNTVGEEKLTQADFVVESLEELNIELFTLLSSKRLLSFDLDGTLDFGNPPGPISAHQLRRLKEGGIIIGGASGKEGWFQLKKWRENGVEPHFVIVKRSVERFKKLKILTNASEYVHIGDAQDDEEIAKRAGFNFLLPQDFINWYQRFQEHL